jgi:hypothetical protein
MPGGFSSELSVGPTHLLENETVAHRHSSKGDALVFKHPFQAEVCHEGSNHDGGMQLPALLHPSSHQQ